MKIEEHIKHWIDGADHDWEAVVSLYSSEKYDWCLFVAHLVLEKLLKALFVQDNNNQFPPKTHNLVKLAKHTDLVLTDDREVLLDEINDFNLEARYPQFKSVFHKKCDKDFTDNYYQKIKEMIKWLKFHLKQER